MRGSEDLLSMQAQLRAAARAQDLAKKTKKQGASKGALGASIVVGCVVDSTLMILICVAGVVGGVSIRAVVCLQQQQQGTFNMNSAKIVDLVSDNSNSSARPCLLVFLARR